MSHPLRTVVVTGGAGFIGSNFIRYILSLRDFDGMIVNLDKLTYAGNLMSLTDVAQKHSGKRYHFEKVDICDVEKLREVLDRYRPDAIVHFAAESHVDRSIHGARDFIETNIVGTYNLLEKVRAIWQGRDDVRFHHVSTDEVYGSLDERGYFSESSPYDPRSPYSASKAASDHLVRAFSYTYGLPVTISNCSNNYGPYQFPEKLIPLMILNLIEEKPLPVYGDGRNIRDWLHVTDHSDAIWTVLTRGRSGETYNIGGANEWENIRLVETLCEIMAMLNHRRKDHYKRLITFVADRPGHDRRYAINCTKISSELDWHPSINFTEGLEATVRWYLRKSDWVKSVLTGRYRQWIDSHYGKADG